MRDLRDIAKSVRNRRSGAWVPGCMPMDEIEFACEVARIALSERAEDEAAAYLERSIAGGDYSRPTFGLTVGGVIIGR